MTAKEIISDRQIIKRFLQLYKLKEGEDAYISLMTNIESGKDVESEIERFMNDNLTELEDLIAFDALDRATRTD